MKFLSLLLSLVLTVSAVAQTPPPVSLKGQQSASKLLPKWNIQVPNNQATNLGGIDALIETGNGNLLANPNFEHSTVATSWTSGGTASAPVVETSNVPSGKQSLCWNSLSSKTFTLTQDSTANATAFADGTVQGVASIRLRTTHSAAIDICPRQAGTTSTTNCIQIVTSAPTATQVLNNNQWAVYRIPFIFGGTSQGISVSAASGSGTTCVDDSFVGPMVLDTHAAIATQSSRVAQTASFGNADITGATTSTQGSGLYSYASGTGIYTVLKDAIFTMTADFRANGAASVQPLITDSAGAVEYGASTSLAAAGNRASASASVYLVAGNTFKFRNALAGTTNEQYIMVTAVEATTVNTYTGQCQSDIECSNEYSVSVDTAAALARISVSGWATSAAASGTNNQIKTLTVPSGVFSVLPVCECTAVATATAELRDCKFNETGSTVTSLVFNSSAGGVASNLPLNITCTKTGVDYKARRQIVGSFKGLSAMPGTSSPQRYVALAATTNEVTVCSASPCTLFRESYPGWVVVTRSGSGQYSAAFSSAVQNGRIPVCHLRSTQDGNLAFYRPTVVTASTLTFGARTNAAAAADDSFFIDCTFY